MEQSRSVHCHDGQPAGQLPYVAKSLTLDNTHKHFNLIRSYLPCLYYRHHWLILFYTTVCDITRLAESKFVCFIFMHISTDQDEIYPWRQNVTTSMVGLENSHIPKNLTQNGETRYIAGECRRRRRMKFNRVLKHFKLNTLIPLLRVMPLLNMSAFKGGNTTAVISSEAFNVGLHSDFCGLTSFKHGVMIETT